MGALFDEPMMLAIYRSFRREASRSGADVADLACEKLLMLDEPLSL